MIKHRARRDGLPAKVNCHTFRATGNTRYTAADRSIENAQAIAAQMQIAKLHNHTHDDVAPTRWHGWRIE